MQYDRNNLINLVKADLRDYPCPQCRVGAFAFKALNYMLGGPVTVDVFCPECQKKQKIKFHIDVV